ncbi:MAG: DUF4340 domain-containing protein [bacterium]|jgi:hypothetical protein|nr:DUF4340 domain-containing protein [bacterium]
MKRNLILIVLCALLAAFYFWDTEREEKKQEQEIKEQTLVSLSQNEIKEITITRHDNVIKAVKEEEQWKLQEPLQALGDASNWNNIITTMADGKMERVIEENPTDLGKFGLVNPTLKVTLAGIGGATATTVIIGKETPVSGKYYAMVEGASEVVTVLSYWQNAVAKSLYDFRDKTVLNLDETKVQKVGITDASGTINLERQGVDQWIATAPFQGRANESAIRDLITKVKNAKVKQFVDEKPDNLEMYGLIQPATKLVFWSGDDPTASLAAQTLLIGATNEYGHFYAKHEDKANVFTIEAMDLEKIPEDAESLRMTKLLAIRSWEAREIKVTAGDQMILDATKQEGNWELRAPQQGKADYNSMAEAVRAITDLEAETFAPPGMDFSSPALILDVSSETKNETIRIVEQTGEDGSKTYFAERLNPLEILQLSASAIDGLRNKVQAVTLDHSAPVEEAEPSETEDS